MAENDLTYFTYNTPIGSLTLAAKDEAIVGLSFGEQHYSGTNKPTTLTNNASNQLQEYFAGKRKEFNLPLAPQGTDFQKEVWNELQKIPYGETRSYSQVAAAINHPKASRAVGTANNKNPIPLLIPCHRVIGANGKPSGYAGGLKLKEFLLNLESNNK